MSQSLKGSPEISIVMPSFNQRRYLDEAVTSVVEQEEVRIELLVLDPGSSDGSRERLSDLAKRYSGSIKLFFERDDGQSDAVNKGMSFATAPILGWLNSDDRLRPGSLRLVRDALATNAPAWLYGRAGVIDHEGNAISNVITTYKNLRGRSFSRNKLLQENFISQMSVFWTRALWDAAGPLSTHKHLDMDYDLWLRFASLVQPVVRRETLADFRIHPDAKGSLHFRAQLDAALQTAKEHAGGELGAQLSVAIHRILSARTALVYRFSKPR